jgi:hypothetical protein
MSTLYRAYDRLKNFTPPKIPRCAACSPLRGTARLLAAPGSSLPTCLAGAAPAAHRAKLGRGCPSCLSRRRPSFLLTALGATLPTCRAEAPPFLLAVLVCCAVRPAHRVERCAAPLVAPCPPCCPPSGSGSVPDRF